MSQINAYAGDGVVGGVDGSILKLAPLSVDAAGSLGSRAGVADVGATGSAVSSFDPAGGIPDLEAPVFANMNSRVVVKRVPNGAMERLLADVMKTLDFKQSMAFRSGAMTLEEVIETAQMGLQYSRDIQKRQGEIVQKARLEAIQQATKDADAGILGQIFGWIGRVFAVIFLALTSIALVSTGQVAVAVLTITALVLTVLDFCGAVSKAHGGPDISFAGLIALVMEACGSSKEAADAVRQWLGLAVQMVTVILGAAGGYAAASKVGEMIGKVANIALSLASGATSLVSGTAGIVVAKERHRLIETQVAEMQAQAFHEVLLASTKRWAEDFQNFKDDLDAALQHRSDWLSKEHALNVRLAAA